MENPNAERAETNIEHKESLKQEIDRSLRTLTERQKEVICFFFGIGVDHPMSLEDIGERFNLTRERVRQIKDKAIKVLVFNSQNATPDVTALVNAAKAKKIPVTTVTETLSPAGLTFQAWQSKQLAALQAALAKGTGS